MTWLNSLYTRLALGLVLLLFVIGALYAALNAFATKQFFAELNQDLHRNVAQSLVADMNLVEQGKLNEDALKSTFQQYMTVNPSIEIYLLDLEGKLLSYSADPQVVKRNHVSLAPIKAFLSGAEKYPMGDDPRSHDKQKAFSVTGVPSNDAPEGYLYVVLRGEQYDAFEAMAFEGFWVRTGLWSMVLSLLLGLLAGLAIFYLLTKRLRMLSGSMDRFSASDFTDWSQGQFNQNKQDEIGQIERTFSKMAGRIQTQLSALTDKDNQRRQLVAQVSHDLRTPLASMLGYLESLRIKGGDISSEQHEKFLGIAYTQGQRLSSMIDSLFELSSLEAKEVKPELEPFMPLEVLHDVRQKHLLQAKESGLELVVAVAQSEEFALGDISLFERVLDNLIDNAMVHAKANTQISMCINSERALIEVSVHNVGEQIDEQDQAYLFEPFYQANAQSADKRHAGLGLAISRRIMKNLQGDIDVKNRNNGVVFTVYLQKVSV